MEIRQSNGTEYFLHADGLGSIVATTDINGNVVERIEYESYGQPVFLDERGASPVVEEQSFTGSPFAFTGQPYDNETGLYFYRARYYDPLIGIFLQEDHLFAVNLYLYAQNNPLAFRDPSGQQAYIAPILGAAAGAYTAYISGGNAYIGFVAGAAFGLAPELPIGYVAFNAIAGGIGSIAEQELQNYSGGYPYSNIDFNQVGMETLQGGIAGSFGKFFGLIQAAPAVQAAVSASINALLQAFYANSENPQGRGQHVKNICLLK